jgi:hypothetical protein
MSTLLDRSIICYHLDVQRIHAPACHQAVPGSWLTVCAGRSPRPCVCRHSAGRAGRGPRSCIGRRPAAHTPCPYVDKASARACSATSGACRRAAPGAACRPARTRPQRKGSAWPAGDAQHVNEGRIRRGLAERCPTRGQGPGPARPATSSPAHDGEPPPARLAARRPAHA